MLREDLLECILLSYSRSTRSTLYIVCFQWVSRSTAFLHALHRVLRSLSGEEVAVVGVTQAAARGRAVGIEVVWRFGEVRHRCGIVWCLTDDD